MKIAIVGAGALGSALGGTLVEGGSEVWLINRSKPHIDAITASGLTLISSEGEKTIKVNAALNCDGIGVADLIIILVKSFHTRAAIQSALPLIGEETVVLSLQNGLGHEALLAEEIGEKRLIAGKTYVGGVMQAPGRIIAGTKGKETIIGELDGRITERILKIAETFKQAGLWLTVSENVLGTLWDKLLINVATGAVSAISGLTYGELYQIPELEQTALAAVNEAIEVARAKGIHLSISSAKDAWTLAAKGLPYTFKTSMLQSLEKGSMTEIEFVNGAVVREGKTCGILTPVNETLLACVKGIERNLLLTQKL